MGRFLILRINPTFDSSCDDYNSHSSQVKSGEEIVKS